MCGLCGVNGYFKDNGKIFKALLLDNEPRGLEATGVIWKPVKSDEYKFHKAPVRASVFLKGYMDIPDFVSTDVLIGHTRNSTRGDPENNQENHPHFFKSWMIVHNGVIDNADELYKKCRIVRKLECDSAVIPVVFEKFGFEKGLSLLGGWFSIIAVNTNEPGQIYIAKNDTSYASVYIGRMNDDVIMFSSKEDLLKRYCPFRYTLKDNTWKVYSNGTKVKEGKFKSKSTRKLVFENVRTIGLQDNYYEHWKKGYSKIEDNLIEYGD